MQLDRQLFRSGCRKTELVGLRDDAVGVVGELDRHARIVGADLLERVGVRVLELGPVRADENRGRVDQVEQSIGHVLPTAVVREFEEIDRELVLAALVEYLSDRRFEFGRVCVAREQELDVVDLEEKGDARSVRDTAVLAEHPGGAGLRPAEVGGVVECVEEVLDRIATSWFRPLPQELLQPVAGGRQQCAARRAGHPGHLEGAGVGYVDRSAADDSVPSAGRDQPVESVPLAGATARGIGVEGVDQLVELVASVEPDVAGGELLRGEGFDHALDVIEIDVGDDDDVELGRLIRRLPQISAESLVVAALEPTVDQDPKGPVARRAVFDDEAVAALGRQRPHRDGGHRPLPLVSPCASRVNPARSTVRVMSPCPKMTWRFAAASM